MFESPILFFFFLNHFQALQFLEVGRQKQLLEPVGGAEDVHPASDHGAHRRRRLQGREPPPPLFTQKRFGGALRRSIRGRYSVHARHGEQNPKSTR